MAIRRFKMKKSAINRLVELFLNTFSKLGKDVSLAKIEELSVLVHCSMDVGKRNFHTTTHIFDVCQSLPPVPTLAIIFHDIIYLQVDGGLPERTEELLTQFVETKNGKVVIKENIGPEQKLFLQAMDLFGFKLGQELSPFGGLNEFLSAVVAVKSLESLLSPKDLLIIMAAIEGTVPFRPNSYVEDFVKRLEQVNVKWDFKLSPAEKLEMIHLSMIVGNRDVENFSFEDPGEFLSNTWILIPETNAILWSTGIYCVSDYRQALSKMEQFLNFLNPENIFHQYKNIPNEKDFEYLKSQAHKNILVARKYLAIKLFTIALIEALALCTGGDAPVSMFLGDVKTKDQGNVAIAENYLPEAERRVDACYDKNLLSLLESGRASDIGFDMKNSPISAYIYKCMGDKMIEYLQVAKQMFAKEISAQEFLEKMDTKIVSVIDKTCSEIAVSRKKALLLYIKKLES